DDETVRASRTLEKNIDDIEVRLLVSEFNNLSPSPSHSEICTQSRHVDGMHHGLAHEGQRSQIAINENNVRPAEYGVHLPKVLHRNGSEDISTGTTGEDLLPYYVSNE
ncbi:hypothetical protein PanWU01x14_085240, partial [Parasponia andersonii]